MSESQLPSPPFFPDGESQFTLKDSGEREEFSSGARRDTQTGKGRYDLIPPLTFHRKAILLEKGASKYDAHNWEKGMSMSRLLSSGLRHLTQWRLGLRDEDHLTQALFNFEAILHFEEAARQGLLSEEQKKLIFDLPSYVSPPTTQTANE